MKLLSSPSSPFVRKVKVVALETDQRDLFTDERVLLSPVNPNDRVNDGNPLGKIPVLLFDDGSAMYDSRVICEYLDTLHSSAKIFPVDEKARWDALQNQSIGDGIMDAGVLLRFETAVKPGAYRWKDWNDEQMAKVSRALDTLERKTDSFGDTVDIGTIAVACALGYLDFRFPDNIRWRVSRPTLASWYEVFAARPSMEATVASD